MNEIIPRTPIELSGTEALFNLPSHKTPREHPPVSAEGTPIADQLSPRTPDQYTLMPNKLIHTAMDKKQFYAKLLKGFPPQNGWKLFETLVNRWGVTAKEKQDRREKNPQSDRQLLIWGTAGTGKTSTIEYTYELIYGKPAKIFNAGNRPLNHLMVEPRLVKTQENIPKILEKAYNEKKLNPNTIDYLKTHAPEAFSKTANGTETLNLTDPNKFPLSDKNIETLRKIAELEGHISQGSTIGVQYVEGDLIHAIKNGEGLIIDEVDKSIEDGSNQLSLVFQALSGNKEETTYKSEGFEITINRKKIHPEFDLIFTANDLSNGTPNNWAGQHILQRITPFHIEDNGVSELTTRILQSLVGFNPIPLQLSYNTQEIPTLSEGLFKLAGTPLSQTQIALLKKGDKLFQAAQQIACMIYAWDTITKTQDSDMQLQNSRNVVAQDISVRYAQTLLSIALDYEDEMPAEDKPRIPLGITDINDALAHIQTQLEKAPQNRTRIRETGIGEKIQIIITEALKDFACETKTRHLLTKAAQICRCIEIEISEENNQNHNGIKPLKDLLNTLETDLQIEPKTYELRDEYAEILKKSEKKLKNIENETLIPIKTLQIALNHSKELSEKTGPYTYTVGLSPTYLQERSGSPLALIPILDQKLHYDIIKSTKDKHKKPLANLLCNSEEVEASLKNPTIRKNYTKNIWNPTTEETTQDDKETINEDELAETEPIDQYDYKRILKGNPTIQAARVLCSTNNPNTPNAKKISPIIIIQSEEKNTFVAYSADFKSTEATKTTCITNNPKEAAKCLLNGFKAPEDQLLVKSVSLYLKTPHPKRTLNPDKTYTLADQATAEKNQKELQKKLEAIQVQPEKEAIEELEKNIKEAWELDFNQGIDSAKVLLRETVKTPDYEPQTL